MKARFFVLTMLSVWGGSMLLSCEKNQSTTKPVITLSAYKIAGKSGNDISVTVAVVAENGIKAITATKGINLQPDMSFGEDGVFNVELPANVGNSYEFEFTYTLMPEDVGKLVGLHFNVETSTGGTAVADLELDVSASVRQMLSAYRWKLRTKFHESAGADDTQACAKDNTFVFSEDGTIWEDFGVVPCDFDGFNVYSTWALAEDDQGFTMIYYSAFDPQSVTVEDYKIRSISRDRLVLEIEFDLTWAGLGANEIFVFTYDALPLD